MKNSIFYIIAIWVFVSSCDKKTEELFDKNADERITEVLTNYQNALAQAPGWKLFVYPEGLESQDIEVGGLTFYVRFTSNNRVTMVSDFNTTMAGTPKESGYRLKAAQRPSLIFDTYSYIHTVADPDPNVSFSPTQEGGYGWGSDFDFSFTETTPKDTIKLKGNFNNSDALLVKATQDEINNAFSRGGLASIVQSTADYADNNAFLYFPGSDNTPISVSFNLFLYTINFSYLVGGQLVSRSEPFSHTTYGLHFKDPITVGGYTFQDAYWDQALQVYYIRIGNNRINITNASTPPLPFNVVIGKTITTITIPTTALPGQSSTFTTVYNTIKTNLKNSGYNLDLKNMDFIFDDESKTMALVVNVQQTGANYVLQYIYNYSLNASSIAKFSFLGADGNGNLVLNNMQPLLNYINNDRFKLDYFTGASPVLGQFTSQERPNFSFTGSLK